MGRPLLLVLLFLPTVINTSLNIRDDEDDQGVVQEGKPRNESRNEGEQSVAHYKWQLGVLLCGCSVPDPGHSVDN